MSKSNELKRLENLYKELRNLKEENKELKEIENYTKSKNKKLDNSYLQTERMDKLSSSLTVQTVRYNNTLRNCQTLGNHDNVNRYSKSNEKKNIYKK